MASGCQWGIKRSTKEKDRILVNKQNRLDVALKSSRTTYHLIVEPAFVGDSAGDTNYRSVSRGEVLVKTIYLLLPILWASNSHVVQSSGQGWYLLGGHCHSIRATSVRRYPSSESPQGSASGALCRSSQPDLPIWIILCPSITGV